MKDLTSFSKAGVLHNNISIEGTVFDLGCHQQAFLIVPVYLYFTETRNEKAWLIYAAISIDGHLSWN